MPRTSSGSRTLSDKVWDSHVVVSGADSEPDLVYIDLHLVHEVTSAQAFDGVRMAGRTVRRPDLTLATADHNIPTVAGPVTDPISARQIEALTKNCAEFAIPILPTGHPRAGIVHVIAPELGFTLPGMTVVNGTAAVRSATVRCDAGRWYVSFTVEARRAARSPARPDAVIGVDLSVGTLAVFCDGRPAVENPKHYDQARRTLATLSRVVSRRVGPHRGTGQQPSKRWQKANERRNRVHRRVTNQRRDGIHKLTTALAREYGTVVVEDLNVSGMVKNRRLARVISDAGFGEIRRQLAYKTEWNGGRLDVADCWFPSSKTCSSCQAVTSKLPLRVRTYVCENCGLIIDRDGNVYPAPAPTGIGSGGDLRPVMDECPRFANSQSNGVTASYARSIGDFLIDLTNGGRSPHTVRGYRGDLAAFAAHRPGGADTIDVGVLRGCLATLTGLSPATRVRYTPWGGCTDSSM